MSRAMRGETWLPCPVEECVDGMVKVEFKVWPGEEPVRHLNRKAHPGAPDEAEIIDLLDTSDCDPHRRVDRGDLDRLEQERQDQLLEAGEDEWEYRGEARGEEVRARKRDDL